MRRGIVVLLVALLLLSGCAAQQELSGDEQDGKLNVSTDWSKLDERRKPLPSVGSRWYDEYTGQLILRDDYGQLIPYIGLRLMADWPAKTGCLYGLMTMDGVVVTDAVYSEVTRPFYTVGERLISHPLLALRAGKRTDEEYGYKRDWAIAANDGSWCTEFLYRGICAGKDGLLLFEDRQITYMSPTGEILGIWTMAELGLTREEVDWVFQGLEWGEGYFGIWFDDYFSLGYTDNTTEVITLLHIPTGQKETIARDDLWDILTQTLDVDHPDMEDFTTNLPPDNYIEIYYLWDSFADDDKPAMIYASHREEEGARDLFFLNDGTPLPKFTKKSGIWYYSVRPMGGLIEVLDLNTASYYDLKTMDCVFRTYLGYDAD